MNTESQNIGDYLRKVRLENKVELEEISKDTRISLTVLKDLEDSKLSNLPGQTYVRGFVTNYLKYLKIEPDEALEILDRAYDRTSPAIEVFEEETQIRSTPKLSFDIDSILNKRVIIGLVIAILVLGFYSIFIYLLKGNQNTSTPEENESQSSFDSSVTTSTLFVTTTTTTSTSTTTTTLEEKESRFPFVKFNKIKKAYYTIDSLDASEEIPPDYRRKSQDSNSLYVRASFGDCWVRYKVDDGKINSFILREGRELHLTGNTFYLNFGSVGNIEIFYNDRVVDAPSKTGFKLMVLPKEEATNHEYPIFADDKDNVPHFYKDYKEKMDSNPEESSDE